jgi:hypothetical protein
MRIRDTSSLYSFSISVCMGAFVFGYQLSSYDNLSNLILKANFDEDDETRNTMVLLDTTLALSAIFGTTFTIQASESIVG